MESDFQTIVYADAQNRKDKYALAKESAVFARCLMIFSCTSRRNTFSSIHHADMMLVPSTTQTRTLDSIEMKEGLSALMETVIQRATDITAQWELGYIHGERYIYRYLWFQDTCLGACVSEKQLWKFLGNLVSATTMCFFKPAKAGRKTSATMTC